MATGTLVTESMVVGAGLHGLDVVLRGIERVEAADLSDGQRAAGSPDRWTLLRFDVDDGKARPSPRRSPACSTSPAGTRSCTRWTRASWSSPAVCSATR
jgi:hypothetical protein